MRDLRDKINDYRLDLQNKGRILKPGSNLKGFSFKTMHWKREKMGARVSKDL